MAFTQSRRGAEPKEIQLRGRFRTTSRQESSIMPQKPQDSENYICWPEERWDVHKHDIHYSNGEREDKRAEVILDMFRSLCTNRMDHTTVYMQYSH